MSYQGELTIGAVPAGKPAEARAATREQQRLAKLINLYRPRAGGFLMFAGYLLVLLVIYLGWQGRMERPLTAESGAGYALGIVGGSLMLLLLLYPLRKHVRLMKNLGPIKYWFRTHMLFGVIGPVCILFHSGFRLGSTNSNIALFCMLTVASSGFVGRYFYSKIHHGLYGKKATLIELMQHATLLRETVSISRSDYPWAAEKIAEFERRTRNLTSSLIGCFWKLTSLGVSTWSLYITLWLRIPRDLPGNERKILLRHMGAQLECVRKVAEYHFYYRLFSIWHLLPFPLFLMLIISGSVHVVAVHLY